MNFKNKGKKTYTK